MKYIFLDIDGVLNCYSDFFTEDGKEKKNCPRVSGFYGIANDKLKNLSLIYNECQAKIILVSSWKSYISKPADKWDYEFYRLAPKIKMYLHNKFNKYKMKISDTTYGFERAWYDRAFGIIEYMKKFNIDKKDIIILDDEDFQYDSYDLGDRFIKTDYDNGGLTEELAKKAVDLLGKV